MGRAKLLPLSLALLAAWAIWAPLVHARPAGPSQGGIPSSFDGSGDYVNPVDGSVFVSIPAGEYFIGALPDDREAYGDEKPGRSVAMRKYQVSLYEVTNAQYARFVAASGYRGTGSEWKKYAELWGPRAPVVAVSWKDARAYCQWAGARLLTEEEWERASRGMEPRIYPWGNEWKPSLVVWNTDRPSRVGSLPGGRSPDGCYDMLGNVWEWTSTRVMDGRYIIRGGCWGTHFPSNLRCSDRNADLPGNHGNGYIGLRCARTP